MTIRTTIRAIFNRSAKAVTPEKPYEKWVYPIEGRLTDKQELDVTELGDREPRTITVKSIREAGL